MLERVDGNRNVTGRGVMVGHWTVVAVPCVHCRGSGKQGSCEAARAFGQVIWVSR